MSSLSFKLALKPGDPGVFWAFWRIQSLRSTGVLTAEWERFKKQIVFRQGEPVASRSNWPHEAFGNFLARRKKLPADVLHQAVTEASKQSPPVPLGEWLVQKALLPGHELSEILDSHFRERIFSLIPLSHGQLEYQSTDEINLKESDQTKLTDPFLKLLWEAARLHLDEASSKARLVSAMGRPLRARGDFPFPLNSKELRFWNALSRDFVSRSKLSVDDLRLLAVAIEFQQVDFGASPQERVHDDLRELENRFKKAAPHEILGVSEEATVAECQKAYLELIKKHHPDRLPGEVGADLRKVAEEVFSKINEAHSVMIDEEKRAEVRARKALEKQGGMEQIEKTLEVEMLIPQAKMALRRRHYKAAHEQYAQITEVIKNDGELLADFAFVKIMQLVEAKIPFKGHIQSFMEEIEKSMKKNSQYGGAYFYRGMIWKLEGQIEKALQDFDQALSLDSSLTEAASEARLLRMRKENPGKKSGLFGKKS